VNWDRLLKIDRRFIFIIIGVVIILPMIFPIHQPVGCQKSTKALFDTVEGIDPSTQCLMISTDYTPQTEAENQPMTIALIRHAMARKLPVVLLSLYVESTPLVADAMNQVVAEFNARAKAPADSVHYGRDVAFLGWQPPPIVPILAMGKSISGIYPTDFYGATTDSLPIMRNIHNYDQVGLVAAIASVGSPLWYVQFAQPKFGVKVAAGCTAVSAPEFYPYFETRQLSGMLGGMKGAAEYEQLVEDRYQIGGRVRASEGMGSQSAAHLAIMLFVVLGNIAYFASKRGK
jgi:hypothetical protein